MEICPVYVSKCNMFSTNQFILLMVCDREHPCYMAVTKLSALLQEVTTTKSDGFYCLSCLHYFRTKNKLTCYRKIFEKKVLCRTVMPSKYIYIYVYIYIYIYILEIN